MLANVADPPDPPCYRLFSQDGIEEYQLFGPDLCSLARANGSGVSPSKAPVAWLPRRTLQGQRQLKCGFAAKAQVRGEQGAILSERGFCCRFSAYCITELAKPNRR
jgi:hypothetical protein